ncbi:hypothetical protein BaRGS_00029610 [Batillaria attramentaria]|uniref:GAR domain-containing protein n=1 Tax=Batillaria attramentaria TaxID=370345 RepID=A0ABD0JWQ3_9CAEN
MGCTVGTAAPRQVRSRHSSRRSSRKHSRRSTRTMPVTPPKRSSPCNSEPTFGGEHCSEAVTIGTSEAEDPKPQEQTFECKCQEYIASNADNIYDPYGERVDVQLEPGKHLLVKVGGGWEQFEDYLTRHQPRQMTTRDRTDTSPVAEWDRDRDHSFFIPYSPRNSRQEEKEPFVAKAGYVVFKSTYKSTGNEGSQRLSGGEAEVRKPNRKRAKAKNDIISTSEAPDEPNELTKPNRKHAKAKNDMISSSEAPDKPNELTKPNRKHAKAKNDIISTSEAPDEPSELTKSNRKRAEARNDIISTSEAPDEPNELT